MKFKPSDYVTIEYVDPVTHLVRENAVIKFHGSMVRYSDSKSKWKLHTRMTVWDEDAQDFLTFAFVTTSLKRCRITDLGPELQHEIDLRQFNRRMAECIVTARIIA